MKCVLSFVAALFACAASALADSAVIPAANATVAGGQSANTLLRDTGNPRTLQMAISPSLMNEIPEGSIITGLTFRLAADGGGSFPPASATYTQYDITLASSLNAPGSLSSTFANNQNVDAVLVRSGSLTFNGSAFPGGATAPAANGWGQRIPFTTPFVWNGSSLVVTIRHSGSNLALNEFVDSVIGGTPGLECQTASAADALTASVLDTVVPIFRFDFVPPTQVTKAYAPRAFAGSEGGTNFVPIGSASASTIQMIIGARELANIPSGTYINGITWRLNGGGAGWPIGAASWTQFDVQLSRSVNAPAQMDTTITNNVGPDATLCRSGALTAESDSFEGGESPNHFGVVIPFSTPYLYRGGDLHILIRHSANGVTSGVFDAVMPADAPDVQCGFSAGAAAVTTTTNAVIPITRLSLIPGDVSPDLNADVNAGSTYAGLFQASQCKYQVLFAPEELASIPVGSTIDGVSWRLRATAGADWPSGGDSWFTSFKIEVAHAATTPATMSTTYATNIGAGNIIARDGPLVIPVGAFDSGASSPDTNRWGPSIRFTAPFVYQGGPLVITFTHTGQNRAVDSSDAIPVADPVNGSRVRCLSNLNAAAVTGAFANVSVLRLSFTPSSTAPGAYALSDANSSTGSALLQVAQSVQTVISESELVGIPVGSTIDGISYRRNATTIGLTPARDLPSASYIMQVATAATTPATMSTTFATNVGAGAVTVYDDPLTAPVHCLLPGLLSPAAQPNFVYFPFSKPFIYQGGPLVITLRYLGATGGADQLVTDGLSTGGAGYGTAIRTLSANGNAAVTGAFSTAPIPRIAFTPPRCFADFNGDGFVDAIDYDQFIALFLSSSMGADINNDQFVDAIDYDLFIAAFLSSC